VQVINILKDSYDDMDVIFIQEAAASFVDHAKVPLTTVLVKDRAYMPHVHTQTTFSRKRRLHVQACL
jgi:hypothetical protein